MLVDADGHEARGRQAGRQQSLAHARLIAGGFNRIDGVMRDCQRGSRRRGKQRSPIVDGDHRRDRMRFGKLDDPARGRLDIVEVQSKMPSLHQARQCGSVFRANHDLDSEARRSGHEVVGPIGPAGDEEEHARHALS